MNTNHLIHQTEQHPSDTSTQPTVTKIIEHDDSEHQLIDIANLVQHILNTQGAWFSVQYQQQISVTAPQYIPYIHCHYPKQLECLIHQYQGLKKEMSPQTDSIREKKFPQTDAIKDHYPIHRLNPYVQLLLTSLRNYILTQRHHLNEDWFNVKQITYRNQTTLHTTVHELNNVIEQIRLRANSKEFKTMVFNTLRMVKQNEKSLMSYINQLFEHHSKLLVLRIDFGYHKNNQSNRLPIEDIEQHYLQACTDFKHLLDNRRSNKLFEHLLGYVWKLEFSAKKGFHFHTLFFFNGANVRQDITLAQRIGDYWKKTITNNNGLYFNCNAQKDEYKFCGIGMIEYSNTELRTNLEQYVCQYLIKPDYHAKLNAPFIRRTFGKGEITKVKDPRGRPRTPRQ